MFWGRGYDETKEQTILICIRQLKTMNGVLVNTIIEDKEYDKETESD